MTDWLDAQVHHRIFVSVITIGEIRKGLTASRNLNQRAFLENWFQKELLPWLNAATALGQEMTVVTHNVRDFARLSVPTINPWEVRQRF